MLKLTAKGTDEAPTAQRHHRRGSQSATSTESTASSDSTACGLGVAGLVAGVQGLTAAVFAVLRGRAGHTPCETGDGGHAGGAEPGHRCVRLLKRYGPILASRTT